MIFGKHLYIFPVYTQPKSLNAHKVFHDALDSLTKVKFSFVYPLGSGIS